MTCVSARGSTQTVRFLRTNALRSHPPISCTHKRLWTVRATLWMLRATWRTLRAALWMLRVTWWTLRASLWILRARRKLRNLLHKYRHMAGFSKKASHVRKPSRGSREKLSCATTRPSPAGSVER
eukprot:6093773-Pyramimonas_sp.AAC.1